MLTITNRIDDAARDIYLDSRSGEGVQVGLHGLIICINWVTVNLPISKKEWRLRQLSVCFDTNGTLLKP